MLRRMVFGSALAWLALVTTGCPKKEQGGSPSGAASAEATKAPSPAASADDDDRDDKDEKEEKKEGGW
ncbi:MAG: hypothetical protein QM756_26060 [Polyangiaceae bacterium]